MREAFALPKASHIFSTKHIGKFKILTFEILTKGKLTTSLVLNNRALMFLGELYRSVGQVLFGFFLRYMNAFVGRLI